MRPVSYGFLAKTTCVSGKVLEVIRGKQKGGCSKTDLRVTCTWLEREVEKVLALRSVKADTAPPDAGGGSPVTEGSQKQAPARTPAHPGDNATPSQPLQLPSADLGAAAPRGTVTGAGGAADVDGAVEPPPPPFQGVLGSGDAPSATLSGSQPATTDAHGITWTARAVTEPVGFHAPRQAWSVRTLTGEIIYEDGNTMGPGLERRPYDYFVAIFPSDQLARMVRLTSAKLLARNMPPTAAGELLKFMGVTILATRYEFGSRAQL